MKNFRISNIAKRTTMLLISAILISSTVQSQDARFTQSFYANPIKLNPAVNGMNPNMKVILNYRSQWGSLNKGFTTSSATVLYPYFIKDDNKKLDFGLNVNNDQAGAFSNLDMSLSVGYSLQIAESGYLSFAIVGGYVQNTLSTNDLIFDDQYVLGSYSATNTSKELVLNQQAKYPDIGFGMMWYYNPVRDESKLNAYLGVSAYHLNKPNETFTSSTGSYLPPRISIQSGIKILGDNKLDFTPNIIISTQNGSEDISSGLYIDYLLNEKAKIVVGTWYRKHNAYSFLLAFEHKSFMFGYSYDMPNTALNLTISGLNTHEITLAYKLNMADKKGIDNLPSFY